MTTNYDMLIEDAYAMHFRSYANDYTYRDCALVQCYLESPTHRSTVIFKIFGSIDEPSDMIIRKETTGKLSRNKATKTSDN